MGVLVDKKGLTVEGGRISRRRRNIYSYRSRLRNQDGQISELVYKAD